jgi:hypothetical protein
VFIKYNSASGDAFASAYGGDARGVLFTPGLPDGAFRRAPQLRAMRDRVNPLREPSETQACVAAAG